MNTTITNEARDERYDAASPDIQFLYSDHTSGRILREVFERHGLDKTLYTDYAILVGDIILGFYPKADLKKLLEGELELSPDIAQKIETDLKLFLSKIENIPSVPTASGDLKEKLELRPKGVTPEKGGAVEKEEEKESDQMLDAKPLTREAVLSALAPKRTMANDIASLEQNDEKVHGYDAYVAKKSEMEK